MLKRKGKHNVPFILVILILIVSAIAFARTYAANRVLSDFAAETVELDAIDLKYEPNPALYFSRGCDGIKMGVTNDQAFSIGEVLTKNTFSRPLTHDLVFDVLNSFKIRIVYAKIDAIKDGIYTAKLLFSDGTTLHEADARPSDMAALVLRYGSKFSISENLVSNMTNVC
ncbi:MAG: bifunctional nuclease family protein [Candidatus Aenigmarchaeota archaeon]|nr:bifunctional nuclease family protein [Candidatus Aenigmarchaeota archaeon]